MPVRNENSVQAAAKATTALKQAQPALLAPQESLRALPAVDCEVGIDMGLKWFAALSTGDLVPTDVGTPLRHLLGAHVRLPSKIPAR